VYLHPEPGVSAVRLADVVGQVSTDVATARGLGGTRAERLTRYRTWSDQAVELLEPLVDRAVLRELVTTPRYWALHALDPTLPPTALSAVDVELDGCARRFERLEQHVREDVARYRPVVRQVVADTNVYLHGERTFDHDDWAGLCGAGDFGEVTLFVPLLVLDELDQAKLSNKDDVRSRARLTLKVLRHRLSPSGQRQKLHPDNPEDRVHVQLVLDPPRHVRLERADDELVRVTRALQDYSNHPVAFATQDVGAQFRAEAQGLRVVEF